jgi:dynactin complex subunit
MHKEKEKLRALKDLYKSLQVSFEELMSSHDNIKESHERLKEAQDTPLVHEAMVVKVDMVVTCDLLCSPTSEPSLTSTVCSKCDASLFNDDIICEDLHVIENDVLANKVNSLTHDLEKACGGKGQIGFILGSQRCSLNREGLGYVPKKGKNAFGKLKTTFVKKCDKTFHKCHKKGHIKKDFPKYKNAFFAHFDHCYVLSHNSRVVHAKFISTHIVGATIWVPKAMVTNIQGPKQV